MAGFLNEGSKGGFQPPLLGGFQQPGISDGKGGFFPDESGQWLPTQLSGLVDWHRSDMGVTLVSGDVSAWADQSGLGHDLIQSSASLRPTHTAAQFGPHAGVDFGPAAADKRLDWSPTWGGPAQCTIFAVVKMRTTGTYQNFISRTAEATPYLGTTAGDGFANRPTLYTNAPKAQWTADLVNNTNYLIKWATDADTETCWVQVNNGTEVQQVSGFAFSPGTFESLGTAVTTQDLLSSVAELIIYNRRLSVGEEVMVQAYIATRYGIVM